MTGYSAVRFHWYTAVGLLLGRAGALMITVIAAAVGRSTEEVSS